MVPPTAGGPSALPTWVGLHPVRVWVGPRADKGGVVYLRWWAGRNWKKRSLKFTLTGCPAAERRLRERKAYEAATDQLQRLTGRRADVATTPSRAITLADTWAIIADPKSGKYPTDTSYRREFAKALREAARILGEEFPWAAFDRVRLREVTRARARAVMANQMVGFRSAQVLGTRLLTIAQVLKDEGHLPGDYQVPGGKEWIDELRKYCVAQRGDVLPEPHRPRYSLEEFRRLLAVAPRVDPRFGLMFLLGAELRSGQVARARRSHLHLPTWDLTIHGRGKKGGTTIRLTPAQRAGLMAALETGYLAACEARYQADGTDYVLFPSELRPRYVTPRDPKPQFAVPEFQRPASKGQARGWIYDAEERAGISHVAGRAWYGARRQAVDSAIDNDVSMDALENIGGWTDPRTPTTVYRDRGREAVREKAAGVRAKVRGEAE